MAPFNHIIRIILALEDKIVHTILQQPGWHRFVGRIYRGINHGDFGADPRAPLRQGEASADPARPGFLRFFVQELVNQLRGAPTPPPPRTSADTRVAVRAADKKRAD